MSFLGSESKMLVVIGNKNDYKYITKHLLHYLTQLSTIKKENTTKKVRKVQEYPNQVNQIKKLIMITEKYRKSSKR